MGKQNVKVEVANLAGIFEVIERPSKGAPRKDGSRGVTITRTLHTLTVAAAVEGILASLTVTKPADVNRYEVRPLPDFYGSVKQFKDEAEERLAAEKLAAELAAKEEAAATMVLLTPQQAAKSKAVLTAAMPAGEALDAAIKAIDSRTRVVAAPPVLITTGNVEVVAPTELVVETPVVTA